MRFRLCSALLIAVVLLSGNKALLAQDRPIGYWRSHLPYNVAIGVATDGNTLFAIAEQSFFSYNAVSGELASYSKVDGMADIGMAQVAYDASTNTVILAYQNSNIDLYKDNSFYNIPAIKNDNVSGAKTINGIYTDRGYAYLSTAFGIVVLNLEKREVKETYVFTKNNQTIPINAFTSDNTYFYAATSKGLYRANRNHPNLQSFAVWTALDTVSTYTGLTTVQQKVFATGKDSLFVINGSTPQYLMSTGNNTMHIDAGKDILYLSVFYASAFRGSVKKIDINTYQITDSSRFNQPRQVAEAADGSLWVADFYDGLCRHTGGDNHQAYVPVGPRSATTFDILAYNKDVWIAHGGHGDNFGLMHNKDGVSHFKDDQWTNYRPENFPPMSGMEDIISLSKDPVDGTIYGGSIQEGMVAIKTDGTGYKIRDGALESKIGEPNVFGATSSAFDQNGYLWVTQLGSENELAMRSPGGQWFHYTIPVYAGGFRHGNAGMIVDDYNQKWYYGPQGGGVIVYNDNGTPENGSDDASYRFLAGKGGGNLPSNQTYCVTKDRDGSIWVGTDDGIGIISCAASAVEGQCDAEIRVVQYDQFPNYLFKGFRVKTIAVDGGNRKWIGTNSGLFLISPDADKQVYKFTATNSPLPSDDIQTIAVDPVTGDVYIGTANGLVSFRGTATEGGTSNTDVKVYPNPVPGGYSGTIAIKGLVTDADVRITDIGGQLIYRTKASGGQAIWNGLDYTGHRPQSGVCLIFITNKDGTQTHVGKMLFQH